MDFKILGSLTGLTSGSVPSLPSEQANNPAFSDLLQNAVGNVVDAQKKAESLTLSAAQGENVPMHEVIQAVSEAELSLQTMVTVRDKAVEAYQQIMQMPI